MNVPLPIIETLIINFRASFYGLILRTVNVIPKTKKYMVWF